MKRMIAGLLLLIGLGAGTVFAEDGYRRERDSRRDEARITHDRWEARRNPYYANNAEARREQTEIRHQDRNLDRQRRDMYWDRR
jgi:hypothetical protein